MQGGHSDLFGIFSLQISNFPISISNLEISFHYCMVSLVSASHLATPLTH